ncbi:MAG: tetratricopeptide repeat protein [Lysobacterales bacterium]|jgi:Flp pilus assembly protein TadD
MDPIEHARELFFKALDHHQRGRLDEAEALYREALVHVPGRVSVISNLATVLVLRGQHEEAQALAERALQLEPNCAEAHAILAEIRRGRQGPQAALFELERVLARAPDDPELHFHRSALLAELGRFDEALSASGRALELRPDHPGNRAHHALLMATAGDTAGAQHSLGTLLREDPRPLAAGEAWVGLLLRRVAEAQGVLQETVEPALLVRALDTPWAAPRRLLPLVCQAAHADSRIGPWLQRVREAWPQRLPPHSWSDLRLGSAIYSHPLLRALLRQPAIPDVEIQHLLLQARGVLLERAARSSAEAPLEDVQLAFLCALAAHTLRQHHLWPVTAEEQTQIEALGERLRSALARGEPWPAAWLPALLAYRPLSEIAATDALKRRTDPAPVQALLAQAAADTGPLPCLRWTHLPSSPRGLALADYLAERITPFTMPRLPRLGEPRVLALAAGGGEWAFELAVRLRGASTRVLDTDARTASALGEQAQRLRLPQLSVAQGGLEAAGAGGYTVIDSGRLLLTPGPLAARLSELRRWLAPRGLLRLRVLGARVRSALRAARAALVEAGFDPATAHPRELRLCLLAMPADHPAAVLRTLPEFHSLGPCGSLLRAWDDAPLGLVEVVDQVQAAGLRLRGLELGFDERAALPKQGPLPADLPAWAALEAGHPRMFGDFYTLWASP